MRLSSPATPAIVAAFLLLATPPARAQTAPPAAPSLRVPTGLDDPLAIGKGALHQKNYAAAKAFFANFLASNPGDNEARFFLGESELALDDPASAAHEFTTVLAAKPDVWSAHKALIQADAQLGDWAAFDKQRALLQAARDRHAPGLPVDGPDVIDRFTVDGEAYTVFAFYKLNGHFHTRYYFIHFTPDGQQSKWFACESDDVDQTGFAKQHPKEAAAGQRSFSLDSYAARMLPNGQKSETQGLIKFYWDGEPTYETVRADVLHVLQSKAPPAVTNN